METDQELAMRQAAACEAAAVCAETEPDVARVVAAARAIYPYGSVAVRLPSRLGQWGAVDMKSADGECHTDFRTRGTR